MCVIMTQRLIAPRHLTRDRYKERTSYHTGQCASGTMRFWDNASEPCGSEAHCPRSALSQKRMAQKRIGTEAHGTEAAWHRISTLHTTSMIYLIIRCYAFLYNILLQLYIVYVVLHVVLLTYYVVYDIRIYKCANIAALYK